MNRFLASLYKKLQTLWVLWALLSLTGCGAAGNKTPTPLPTIVLDAGSPTTQDSPQAASGGVTASGTVVPAREVSMAFGASGTVQTVTVAVGEAVKAGQALASLDSTEVNLAVEQAEADLAAAQVQYDLAQSTEPALRQAELAAATLALLQAQYALADLEQNAPLVTAQAQLALASAQKALDAAQRVRTNMNYPRANQTTIDGAKAFYDLTEDDLKKAKEDYDRVSQLPASDPERARALLDLTDAQKERDRALATLNWYLGKNSEKDIAEADAQLALAQAQLDQAKIELAEVKDGPSAKDLALVKEKIVNAQALLDLSNASSASQQLALAQAHLDAASARLELAKAMVAKLTLSAPFDGMVAALHIIPGEWVMIGQPALVLADLEHLRVETTDLSERDVPKVEIGQPVTVLVKALNQDLTGRVVEISPLADTLGGDVVYQTIIDLDGTVPGLRPGMSAEVQYGD